MSATPSAPSEQDLAAWFQVRDMLSTAIGVNSVETNTERVPPRMHVTFTTLAIPEPVHDLLDMYDAEIEHPHVTDDGTLAVTLNVRSAFETKGTNQIRERGGSQLIAVPPAAIRAAGFETGDTLYFDARENEIRLTRDTLDDTQPQSPSDVAETDE